MWPRFFNSKWFERLFTVALAVITIVLTQGLVSKREYNAKLKRDFEARPTTEQVSTQFDELKWYVDKQDDNNIKALNQHIEESKKSDENLKTLIMSIDGKVNVLLNRTK